MISLQSGKRNSLILQRLQYARWLVRVLFLVLAVAGLYTSVRPALFWLFILTFAVGNFFCGWVCPYGTAQDILGKVGALFLKRKLKMPPFIQRYAQCSRYLLMAFMLLLASKGIADLAQLNAYKSFMRTAGGQILETGALMIMVGFLLISLFFERPFCNYFCSEAVRFGLASFTRIFTIKRNISTCVNCKQCDKACPMNIQPSTSTNVRNAQCINCFQCVANCPVDQTLSYGMVSFRRKPNDIKNVVNNSD